MIGVLRFGLAICGIVCAFCFWQTYIDKGGGISRSEAKPFFYLSALATMGVAGGLASVTAKERQKQMQQGGFAVYPNHQHAQGYPQPFPGQQVPQQQYAQQYPQHQYGQQQPQAQQQHQQQQQQHQQQPTNPGPQTPWNGPRS